MRHISKKQKIAISKANKGKVFTKEHRKRIGDAKRGKKTSIKTKRLLSKILKGRIREKSEIIAIKKGLKKSRHHLYLKQNSNKIIILNNSIHRRLHNKAYDYIYIKYGKQGIDFYLKWFNKNIKRIFKK